MNGVKTPAAKIGIGVPGPVEHATHVLYLGNVPLANIRIY